MRIPNILHFVFGLSERAEDRRLGLSHFLAVKSARAVNEPERILFHCGQEPVGEWWEEIKKMVEVRVVEIPRQIHGRPLVHFAHKSDIIRLQVLREFGGIYLDLDTISIRSLAPFREHGFVIGRQAAVFPWNWKQRIKKFVLEGDRRVLQRPPITGLCNAVMLSEPGSPFVDLWLEAYREFRSAGQDDHWDEHSVKIPLELARQNPGLARLASIFAFHYPLYNPGGLKDLFVHTRWFPLAYLHHLWDSFSGELYLRHLTVEKIKSHDTTYNRIARRFL